MKLCAFGMNLYVRGEIINLDLCKVKDRLKSKFKIGFITLDIFILLIPWEDNTPDSEKDIDNLWKYLRETLKARLPILHCSQIQPGGGRRKRLN